MTEAQLFAYQNPCARAYETALPKYRRIVGRLSIILTVNK